MLFWKIFKCFIKPLSWLRKCKRKTTMRQIKIAVGILGACSCFITLFLYYWHRTSLSDRSVRPRLKNIQPSRPYQPYLYATPFRHVPLDELYKKIKKNISEEDSWEQEYKPYPMIDTPGCYIPLAVVRYKTHNTIRKSTCGKRAVFLKKQGDNKVQVAIKSRTMKKYLRKSANFHCCYQFINRSNHSGHENTHNSYTRCKTLNDGATITLESDFVIVKCFEHDKRNTTHLVYKDVYGFCKKVKIPQFDKTNCDADRFNVLMLGMDSMSISRFSQTMKRTVNYFKENSWLRFRGYHKVDDNTFPNFMAALAGMNISTISSHCSGKMDKCNDLLIWSKLREVGYVTAYGEDYLRLPDTFSKEYTFKKQPTHHYMRPLFISGETEFNSSLVCAGKVPSGQQLLNYALDFAVTYRDDSFFGLFWMNSFSHNAKSCPSDADKMFENFFNQLFYTGVLSNTFVIFFSDHGIRFGDYRLKVESYYEERLPMLFMIAPLKFKGKFAYQQLYQSMVVNQYRLITPYDLYNTLLYVKKMATCDNSTDEVSEGCPNCQSIFHTMSANRTCKDVVIHDKWCSCHNLYPLDTEDSSGVKSIMHVVSYIQSMVQAIKTQHCWACMSQSLLKILRIHFYYDKAQIHLHYVVAFTMTPGNASYEATVLKSGNDFKLVGPISVISGYRGMGQCTINSRDRLFCLCQKKANC